MTESKYIWMDGEFVNWHDAKVHVLSHTLHYGNGAIEGTKAYKTVDGRCAIFKLNEHTKRLLNSSKMTLMNVPFTLEELNKAQIELLQKNELFNGAYIRPLVYLGYGVMSLYHKDAPVKDVPVSASKNNIYVNVLNIGCADVQNARLELYHAIPPSDLTWPDGWTNKTININGQDVLISGKLLDIEIPKLKRKDTWTGLYSYKPVNPNLVNKTEMPLNILARIVSPVDKMKEEEGPNTLFNVFSNNNIAWNIFTIIK